MVFKQLNSSNHNYDNTIWEINEVPKAVQYSLWDHLALTSASITRVGKNLHDFWSFGLLLTVVMIFQAMSNRVGFAFD